MIWVWSDHCVSAAIVASCASHDIELVTIIIFTTTTAIVAKGGSGYARLAIGVVEQA